jgi:hypothetical protein
VETHPFQSKTLYDTLSTLEGGINSDVDPLLIPKNTLAWSINASLRGGFVKQRPAFLNRTLVYASGAVETGVQSGLFQGAGYYRPDYGPQQLVAQIAGRLFTFTPNGSNQVDVAEITIPGDPNDATTLQVWMNQAEKWLIITDGTAKLPIFWDGTTARRSVGPSVLLATATAFNPAAPPAIGEVVTVTVNAPGYAGPFNIPVHFNGAFYQVLSSPTSTPTYGIRLTNVSDTPGNTVLEGSDVSVQPATVGYSTSSSISVDPASPGGYFFVINVKTPLVGGLSIGDLLLFRGNTVQIISFTPQPTGVTSIGAGLISPATPAGGAGSFVGGDVVQRQGVSDPNVILGTINATGGFVVPAVGATVDTTMNMVYSGATGQAVWIGTNQYTIEALAPTPAPSTTLYLKNLTDTSTASYVNPSDIFSVGELPAGRMGAYGLGHQTMSLVDGLSFIYGDAVGGPSGTPAYNYRDAVLKTAENTFLQGGGAFRIPNAGEIITSMRFAAVLDAAYGQGPLQVGTSVSIFTCAVPRVRADWIILENPILTETLIGKGPLAQNSTIPVNSDTFFRSTDGEGSMIFGRRDFITWGNTPISAEVTRTMARDNKSLLTYGSAVTFDNRFLGSASPQTASKGIYHPSLLDMNFDPVSSLRGKAPSIWESLWTGINTLQILTGIFSSTERSFAFTLNLALNKIELYEITAELLPGVSGDTYDNAQTPITWEFETASLFNRDVKPREQMISLRDGEFGVSNVIGTVRFAVYYRPDQNSCWVPWHSFSICAGAGRAQYFPRLGLGEPVASRCITTLNTPARDAYTFQVKFVIQGTCTFNYARFMAVTMPTPKFKQPICQDVIPECPTETCTNPADGSLDNTFYSLQTDVFTNVNDLAYATTCPTGYVCPLGVLPPLISYLAGHFTLPNPIFGGGIGPTPEFPTMLSLQGCSSQVTQMVPANATLVELTAAANVVIQAIGAQQAVCDTIAILDAQE